MNSIIMYSTIFFFFFNMMLKNFIVFEGIDGSGTTTQIKKLAERFPKEKVFVSAEPTKNETGRI